MRLACARASAAALVSLRGTQSSEVLGAIAAQRAFDQPSVWAAACRAFAAASARRHDSEGAACRDCLACDTPPPSRPGVCSLMSA